MSSKKLNIGHLMPSFPVIQGGMGIGISLSSLAGHVAKCGGIGILSGVQIGFRESDFIANTLGANLRALEKEIANARTIAPNGIIGVNLMVAMKNYAELVKKAVSCKIDLIISGAGLPLDLPGLVQGSSTQIAPIVSSGKAASVICRMWDKRYQYAPDCIVVEGPLAGGHLGFSPDDVSKEENVLDIVNDVKKIASEYEAKYHKSIPVIAAGGIYTGEDVAHALANGADGVQMGTRFVTTYECDAPLIYKEAYMNARKEDIGIIKSPVGMPGRAILNGFIKNPPGNDSCLYDCIHKCGIVDIPYCISSALIAAATGDTENALLFCGSNAYKATHLEHVKDVFKEIEAALA
ncbi:NAD(P)H-dependent flavin oxidoreductase [Cellulosilyticum sp. I15G10I2]|uniref:NAD(P)H-dependent flavin oxidoreductase n=1 Tax=Cellulosilyticum sp. I15G10I2 TaxID=1892843 RepID=UPI00085C7DFC|nr:nitronate monooxygenase family protein [Cellulosilyticum sp. I15G10I2]